jgi:hypothetical protein
MAGGHMNRVKRPDTWLHRPMLQNVKKVLANPEPSTHDPDIAAIQAARAGCVRAYNSFRGLEMPREFLDIVLR